MNERLVFDSDSKLDELIAFRHELHRLPETGFDVSTTASRLGDRLAAAGLTVTTNVGGTGLVATLKRGHSSRTIGLRADMDALPITEKNAFKHRSTVDSKFHGCGHDGHSTMLLGAALCLAARGGFDGQIQFVFQPDEENGRGAQAMIDDGLFERFPMDAIFGLHNLPGMPVGRFATQVGPFTAFEERFEIEIQGKGGHSSTPEKTIDPMIAGAEIVLALQNIVARSVSPRVHGVVSVTEFIADGARNIIPSSVVIRGDARGYIDEVSAIIKRRMHEIVTGIAAAYGAHSTLRYVREFESVVNTKVGVDAVANAVNQVDGANINIDYGRVGFSEDFAQFLRHRPGCFVLMGNGVDGAYSTPLHNPHYDFNDAALSYGVEFWCQLVLQRLSK
ncbi:MAG: amidohydrolase [Candidimonas sp.]|nr:MAG: amidohydrolase [Candidimonas sp.]TAM25392.1 MAG: amidohydrolase [Candidimonas sp.]